MTESVDINVTETFFVSGGQSTEPFYQFTDSSGRDINFSTTKLLAGQTYKFVPDQTTGVNTGHPFMIGEEYGDLGIHPRCWWSAT